MGRLLLWLLLSMWCMRKDASSMPCEKEDWEWVTNPPPPGLLRFNCRTKETLSFCKTRAVANKQVWPEVKVALWLGHEHTVERKKVQIKSYTDAHNNREASNITILITADCPVIRWCQVPEIMEFHGGIWKESWKCISYPFEQGDALRRCCGPLRGTVSILNATSVRVTFKGGQLRTTSEGDYKVLGYPSFDHNYMAYCHDGLGGNTQTSILEFVWDFVGKKPNTHERLCANYTDMVPVEVGPVESGWGLPLKARTEVTPKAWHTFVKRWPKLECPRLVTINRVIRDRVEPPDCVSCPEQIPVPKPGLILIGPALPILTSVVFHTYRVEVRIPLEEVNRQCAKVRPRMSRNITSLTNQIGERLTRQKRGLLDTLAGWFGAGNSVGNSYTIARQAERRDRLESRLADAVISNARGGLDTTKASRLILDSLKDLSNSVSTSLDITKYLGQEVTSLLINGTKIKALEESCWRAGQTLAITTQGIVTDLLDGRVHPALMEVVGPYLPSTPPWAWGNRESMRVQRPVWTGNSILFSLLVPLGIPHLQQARMVTSLPVWRRGHVIKIEGVAYAEVAGRALYPSECCTHSDKEILCTCPYNVLTNLSRFEVAITEKLAHTELVQMNGTY
ncbi:uncharacterized protein LOC135979666 [Chrysemys picta bellii]|uniref:uncharacterized protein LOC135979666 n=1 Tax=Chrysemys picta bellii TaxID=8478 RepID=UPI0032B1851A